MATFTMSPCEKVLLTFSEFEISTTQAVDFDKTIGGALAYDARQLLIMATTQRQVLVDGLTYEGSRVDPRNVIKGVDAYESTIWRITHSMEASAEANIILHQPLIFSWTSALSAKPKPSENQVLVFEVACILVVKALAHHNLAKDLAGSELHEPKYAEAAKELKIAAGILDYVGKFLLPKWISPPSNKPPEVQIPVVNCLSIMFLGMAQRITIAKAISTNAPKSLIAKLFIGAAHLYERALSTLKQLDQSDFEALTPSIFAELKILPSILKGLANKYYGMHFFANEKYADGTAYLSLARTMLHSIDYTATTLQTFKPKVQVETIEVEKLFNQYNDDLNTVYFEAMTMSDQLLPIQEQIMAKLIPFELQTQSSVSFAEKNSSTNSNSSTSKATTLTAPPGTDPDVFRNLPREVQEDVIAQYQGTVL